MKREKEQRNPLLKGQRLNTISVICLILLMFCYLAMTAASTVQMAKQTDIISNHPFEVVISAGDVKLYVSEMGLRTERLTRHYGSEDIERVTTSLDELRVKVQEPLAQIKKLYLGEMLDVRELEDTLAILFTEQDNFLSFISNGENSQLEIEAYEQSRLQPLTNLAITQSETIIESAQQKKVYYGEMAGSLRELTLAGSVILMLLMVIVLLVSQHMLRRQRKELAYRSQLFDDLSLSIDDTFLIRDAATGEVNYCALNMKRVLGASIVKGTYQGFKEDDIAEFEDTVKNHDFVSPYEKVVEYKKPNGDKRWLLVRIYLTGGSNTRQYITVFSDRTEEILSRQALQDAMLNAERANTAKSEFLSRMSHEIRTPLNAIIGMTTIAAASVTDTTRVEDCLGKINYSSKHLLMLINDVLDMSKIESNKVVLQKESFDIFEVVNGFVSTVYAQAKAKGIEFTECMDGFGEHTSFVGDPLRLNQILLNLSSNAVKFTAPGGKIRLEVSKIASKSTVDVIRFTLSDTGIGMSQEVIDRIYEPFEQADAIIAQRYGGTGLGMSITKNLVTLMSGEIRIESEPGVGTTCAVDIPFQRGVENVQEPDFEDRGLCALIVDDEQQVCEQTAILLEKIKIRAEWELSGDEAFRRIRKVHRDNQDFDLCLIDWKMPDMDGIELTRRIRREIGEDIPVVMITAYDISEVEQEAREAGVNGFLPKPLYRSSIYAVINETLNNKKESSPTAEQKDIGQPLSGSRLLVVEDNVLNQEIAAELLKMNGAQTRCANNGQEALDQFLASQPGDFDAILMDVQMPVMNGYEATKCIRTSSHPMAKTIPIIATTANAFSDDISAALAAGMNAHVSKPLDIKQLCRVLGECICKDEQ